MMLDITDSWTKQILDLMYRKNILVTLYTRLYVVKASSGVVVNIYVTRGSISYDIIIYYVLTIYIINNTMAHDF